MAENYNIINNVKTQLVNFGGGKKCYMIPDLKLNLLNKFFFLLNNDNNFNIDFKECSSNGIIDLDNESYLLNFTQKV